jgi:hypothetical protein
VQRAPRVIDAGLALLGVPQDQVTRLLGELPIPVRQQFPDHRAGLSSGKCSAQRTERLLQPTTGACGQDARAIHRHAERNGEIVVKQIVPEAQLYYLTLSRLHVGQDGADQLPQLGVSQITVDIA